jgi:hypothetical protein
MRQPPAAPARFGMAVCKYSPPFNRRQVMELHNARQIIDTLAQGIHPVTGEAMPQDSPYNAPPVIRALFAVSQALDAMPAAAATVAKPAKPRAGAAGAPVNAGKPWSEQDDAVLNAGFDRGDDLKTLADALGRTRFGIEQRLVKLGRITVPGGGRFGAATAG